MDQISQKGTSIPIASAQMNCAKTTSFKTCGPLCCQLSVIMSNYSVPVVLPVLCLPKNGMTLIERTKRKTTTTMPQHFGFITKFITRYVVLYSTSDNYDSFCWNELQSILEIPHGFECHWLICFLCFVLMLTGPWITGQLLYRFYSSNVFVKLILWRTTTHHVISCQILLSFPFGHQFLELFQEIINNMGLNLQLRERLNMLFLKTFLVF